MSMKGTDPAMNKGLALYFAIVGTVLLAVTAGSISFRHAGVTVLLAALTVLHIGLGFIVRARMRKKQP